MELQKNQISRRDFLKSSALGLATISTAGLLQFCSKSASGMPMRTLGKTGLQVSMLGFGAGSQFQKNKDGEWEPLIERAIELGINFFDTASSYKFRGNIASEAQLGTILPQYRKQLYISTKFDSRNPDDMLKEVETSLKLLKTDYLDVLMIHSIEPSEDIAMLEQGVYKEMRRLKEEGVTKFIGFSSMNSAEKSKEVLEKLEMDVCILAMNPTQYGNFAEIALPVAREKNVGTFAMKVMRNIVGKDGVTAKDLMTYALTQEGITSAFIGHFGMEVLEENVRLVKEIADTPVTAMNFNRRALEQRLAPFSNAQTLCWARSDYVDGVVA